MRHALAVVALVACGRIDFVGRPDATGLDAPRCTPTIVLGAPPSAPFSAPIQITELGSPDFEDDPSLTSDLLEIFFESGRGGASRIWRATRLSQTEPWTAPVPVTELDGTSANTPEISRDGLRLTFAAPAAASSDLFVAVRPDRSSPFGAPVRIAELASSDGETGAVEFLGGAAVVFFSNRPGAPGNGDLWQAIRHGVDCSSYAAPSPLPGAVNTAVSEANPWMRDDGLVVVYVTPIGAGPADVVVATRADLASPFGAGQPIVELNNPAAVDDDPWMNDEMDYVVFTSLVTGDGELYYATR